MAKRILHEATAPALQVPQEIGEARPRPRGGASRRYRRVAVGIAIADGITGMLAVMLCSALFRPGLPPGWSWVLVGLTPIVLILVFTGYGLYRVTRLTPAQEFRRLFAAVSVGVIVLGLTVNVLAQLASDQRGYSLGIGWIGAMWILLLASVMIERKVWHGALYRMRLRGELAYRTLVVGANQEARDLATRLAHGGVGYHAIGLVATGDEAVGVPVPQPAPDILGDVDGLPDTIERHDVDCLFVVSSAVGPERLTRVLQIARQTGVEVRISASMPEILVSRLSLQTIGGTLAMSLDTATLSGSQAALKRAFDIVVGSAVIVVSSPLWLAAALAVKGTSRGPVLFRQHRVGRHGRTFTIHKFRTMVVDAEQRRDELLALSRGPLFKLETDPRLTRVGRFLRRWSIDELPQLIDVLRGDMSLVGPRPLVMFERSELQDWHLQRLEVPPGITGLWQVSGRSDLSFDECVQLDVFYIENWSVTYDLYILLKTIPAVLRRRGAY